MLDDYIDGKIRRKSRSKSGSYWRSSNKKSVNNTVNLKNEVLKNAINNVLDENKKKK